MTQPRQLAIAYPDNQLTQRYLAARSIQGKELEFSLPDGTVIKGFVTGIDDDNYQVCASDGLNAELVSTRHAFNIRETGRTFSDLSLEDEEAVKRYTKIFRRVAEKELSGSDEAE